MTARGLIAPLRGRALVALAAIASVAALQLLSIPPAHAAEGGGFVQANLVSDLPNVARVQDANLANPWGLSHSPTSPWWISDNGAGVSTLYDGSGTPFPPAAPLVVAIPAPGATSGGTPTGNVFNTESADFVVGAGGRSGASIFIFATEDGTIAGWSPAVNRTQAITMVDNSAVPDAADGAVYKGLTLAHGSSGPTLLATNFRSGAVDVFNRAFQQVRRGGAFTDRALPAGYAPFGIQAAGDRVLVSYAKQDADRHDDVAGPGNGFVDVFTADGGLVRRLISRGDLNSPWGIAIAPSGFGALSRALLVGNFGDGRINAFNAESGASRGTLRLTDGTPFQADGLWGIAFGNGATAGPEHSLFFTAGIDDEQHGLFGSLTPVAGR